MFFFGIVLDDNEDGEFCGFGRIDLGTGLIGPTLGLVSTLANRANLFTVPAILGT